MVFLTTRVKSPTEEDMDKVGRVIKYLRFTQDLKLTLECNHVTKLICRADGAHAVHPDMRGHIGGVLTLGKGAVYSTTKY